MLHISQIRRLVGGKRIDSVEDVLNVGDKIEVELEEVDDRGKLSLIPVLTEEQLAAEKENAEKEDSREGRENRGKSEHHRSNRQNRSRRRTRSKKVEEAGE